MKRLLTATTVAIAIVAVALVVRSSGPEPYRVQVVFDTAKGLVPGQQVKVAGAHVGTITDVRLLGQTNPKALLTLKVDRRFAPFRADARCHILPEGFISENFVDCTPGRRSQPPLPDGPAGLPRVPVTHTTTPVSLQDVVNIFSLPVSQRIRVIVDALGLGTAGRGDALNAALRRANPALVQTDRLLGTVNRQNRALHGAIENSDAVLAMLGRDSAAVRRFVRSTAAATSVTARHAARLSDAVRDLPPLLDEMDRSFASVRSVARDGTPILEQLRRTAPALQRLSTSLPDFVAAGKPALAALGKATRDARGDLPAATSVAERAAAIGQRTKTVGQIDAFLRSLRGTGAIENTFDVAYKILSSASGYDKTSHMISLFLGVYARCIADPKQPGCRHTFNSPAQGAIPVNSPSSAVKPLSDRRVRSLLDYLLR